ncbi:mitochondrial ribosomal protein MRP51 [Chaetomidium leptoderma]|uniref:Mitochondrial ribosomal protein MRP51 n=1 Tax=Chaetomidium leptoderma TaxID=669021 RepID=A0AAN6ZXB6_9PEZI|nr:mitochondrial ribosomal protein MRP51 [Chaetomidium leptoderma]
MAARSVSPGGALLRASRMFALPTPIPAPSNEASAGTNYSSNTATLAFPTHQVITTLSSSRKKGDWGLKRPLPLKSTTKSSNPMLRVKAIDTIEQITDYTSATDHGITLRKFQELGMPLTARRPAGGEQTDSTSTMNLPQKSVFEDELDVTDIHPDKRAQAIDTRWKFSGPWLAGQTQGEFKKWLAKEVRPKRSAFREFLKKNIARELHAAAAKVAVDKGQDQPALIDPSSVTEDQLIDYLRKLRHNNQALYDMVGQFLDLAPLKPPTVGQLGLPKENLSTLEFREMKNPYAERGPPVTHPSAGLSYLRTSMYMENHPIYGPQRQHSPAVARIVRPRRQTQALAARLGVAGLIVNTPLGDTASNSIRTGAVYDRIDPSVEGGAKVWVQPQRASIDSNGRVILTVNDSSPEATLVAQELLGDATCLGVQPAEGQMYQREKASDIRQRYRAPDAPTMSSAQDYGLRRQ